MLALMLVLAAGAPPPSLESLLVEAIRFPTVAGNDRARRDQQAWLLRTAAALGLAAREAGPVTEIELAGPPGAPVLGLVVHGDVQPVEESRWAVPPFEGAVREGKVFGRGAADDKGPMVQALLAMHALRGAPLTHTVRLLVGSDEESSNLDIKTYLAAHAPPAYSLVLDSAFPVVVGEKAWDGLQVTASDAGVEDLVAGLAPSIVPDFARLTLRVPADPRLGKPDDGTKLELSRRGELLDIVVRGKAAHAGVNIEGGRNALVSLAHVVKGAMPDCPAADLLAFAAHVRELQLPADAGWGGWAINPATVKHEGGKLRLIVNLRRPPPLTGEQSQARLFEEVKRFSPRLEPGAFYFADAPLAFDRDAKLVKRLLADYAKATGADAAPAISGGGTYAKRMPNAIAFGMWFPDKPYPGHDVDEQNPLSDLQRGLQVLTATLRDIATGPQIRDPFKP
jgi:succinyl-diaminopimelate desuccinylase